MRIGALPDQHRLRGVRAPRERPGRVAERLRNCTGCCPSRKLILGVDRLDYTKGIPLRLKAFQHLLERHPELRERVSLIQVVVPSREDIPEYHRLRTEIEQLVGEINGRFTRPGGWVPIWYVYRSLSRTELLAYYRAAEIALITPLKDGMNLVAKEYCACSIEEDCVLILSRVRRRRGPARSAARCWSIRTTSRAWPTQCTAPPACRPTNARARMRRHARLDPRATTCSGGSTRSCAPRSCGPERLPATRGRAHRARHRRPAPLLRPGPHHEPVIRHAIAAAAALDALARPGPAACCPWQRPSPEKQRAWGRPTGQNPPCAHVWA